MAGTRTAPAVDRTAPTLLELRIRSIDHTGDIRSDLYLIDSDSTDAEIEAIVAAHQATTNASVYRVDLQFGFNSVEDSSNSDDNVYEDVSSNVVVQMKTAQKESFNWFIPAPDASLLFIAGTEEINPASAELAALLTALLPVRNGYDVTGARFSQRSVKNSQVRF